MEKLTYKQAYDKIIDAYFKGEIEPGDNQFCFCGTLANDDEWRRFGGMYRRDEYLNMEHALFSGMSIVLKTKVDSFMSIIDFNELKERDKYEEALFEGMCAAIEVLKDIHRSRGENVDEDVPVFTKRQL